MRNKMILGSLVLITLLGVQTEIDAQAIRCSDSDFSRPGQLEEDRLVRGSVRCTTRNRRGGQQVQTFWDSCEGENLIERACRNVNCIRQNFRCPEGEICEEGACAPLQQAEEEQIQPAPQTTRVSVSSNGVEGNMASISSSISQDGRYVAFESYASNLVVGDNNETMDIFVHDTELNQTTRVSVSSNGDEANSFSGGPKISANGRYVVFQSRASNLVAGDNNSRVDIFVHDRQNGQTTRESIDNNGNEGTEDCEDPSISADGRYVTFESEASNLVAGDNNRRQDIFVRDRQLNKTTRVSVSSNGEEGNNSSWQGRISADGRYVAFSSYATNLKPGDNNRTLDVFVHDQQTGSTVRVSVSSNGVEGNNYSQSPSISADGRYITFESEASNLVAGDNNNAFDIFIYDQQTGSTARISVSNIGVEGNGPSRDPSINSDGRYIAFNSSASNLISEDNNNLDDVFVYDQQTHQFSRVSVGSNWVEGNGASSHASISGYGHSVSFASLATNLIAVDNNGERDVFVVDLLPH